jgi:hypothetical protein
VTSKVSAARSGAAGHNLLDAAATPVARLVRSNRLVIIIQVFRVNAKSDDEQVSAIL